LLAGLVATTAIILIPFIPHLASVAVPYIVNILIPVAVEAVVGFFAGAGVAGQVIGFLTLHVSTVTLITKIAFIILSYMVISALLRKILFDKDALLREALPWSTFMSVGGKSKALLAFVQIRKLKLSFIFGVFVLASACLMWSTAWTIVFMILLFSWFRGPIKAWMMAKKTEKGFGYVVRAIARVPFIGFPIATAIFGIYDLITSFNDIWNAASNNKAVMNSLLDKKHSLFELHKALANIVSAIGFCAGLAIFIWLIYVTPIGAGGLIAYIKFAGLIMAFSTIPLILSYVIIYVPLLIIGLIRWVTALSGHDIKIGYKLKDVARDFAKSLRLDKLVEHLKNKEFDKVLDVLDAIINRVLHPFKHLASMLSNTASIIGLVIGMVISALILIDITLFAIYGMSMFSTGLIAFAGIAGSVILAFTIPLICGYLFAHFPAVAMAAVFWVAVNVFNVDTRFGMELSLDIFGYELNADSINNLWLFLISPALLELIISQIIGVKDTIIGGLKDLINLPMPIITSIKSIIMSVWNRFKRSPSAPAPTSPPADSEDGEPLEEVQDQGTNERTSPIGDFDQSIEKDVEWIQSDMEGDADIVIGFPFFNEVPSGNVIRTGGGQVNAAELAVDLARQAHLFYPDKKIAIVIIGESNDAGRKYFDELNELLINQDIEPGQVQLFTFTKEKRFASQPGMPQGKKWTTRALLKISQSLNADTLFLADGDVTVGPDWVKRFLDPTLTGQADVTSPDYARFYSTDDAAISDLVIQPLLAVTYGLLLQEPIAGDYGIRNTLFGVLLDDNAIWVSSRWFETRFHAAVIKADKVVEEIHIPIPKIHKANTLTQTIDRFHAYIGITFETLIRDNEFWKAQNIDEPPLLGIDSRGTAFATTRVDITPEMRQQGLIDGYGIGSSRLTNGEWCEALASGFYRYAAAETIDARTQVLDDLKKSFVTRLVTLSEQIESENSTLVDLHHVFNEEITVLHKLLRTSPVTVVEDKDIIDESMEICEDTKNAALLLEQAIKELPWAGPIPMGSHATAQREAASIETITSKINSIIKNTDNAEIALNEINSHIDNIEIALRKLEVLGPEGNEYYKDVITESLSLTMQKALELQARLQRISEIIAEISVNRADYITENETIISDLEIINKRLGALRVRIEETMERIETLRPFDVPRPERFRLDEIPREEELHTGA